MARLQDFAAHKFDYIIIGGGTAGLVLARRLSDRANLTVGVVEAGPAALEEPAINIPGRFGETLNSKYDWKFETTRQSGLDGRTIPCPRGRVLGGTSALNFMAWNRGNREDYDAWAELGNEGWGWKDLLPFFKRSETFHAPDASHQETHRSYYQPDVHGTCGPVQTTHAREYGPAHQFWHDTLNSLNVETSPDSLGGKTSGAWNMVCSINPVNQARSYSATAYYYPVRDRPNLVVLPEATVTEIIMEEADDDWRATGVRIRCNDQMADVSASREVILCAGSIQSPQLLELSGIGSRRVLDAAGVPVKIENANVGENLQDHLMTATIFEVDPSLPMRDDILRDPELRESADKAYDESRTGPWTVLPCSIAYCPLSTFVSPEELSDLQSRAISIAQATGLQRDEILVRQFQDVHLGQIEYLFDVGNWSPYFPSQPGKKYGTMLQMLQYPFSRGSVHIPPASSWPTTVDGYPMIDPRIYLGPGEVDRKVMNMAQEFGARICATEPLFSIIQARVAPADNDLESFVVHNTITDWHPIGTCAMGGKQGDKTGVVDHRLRVYGTRGLRVADASIMPLQVGAHIQATVYAIAEKAAAMILEDVDRSPRPWKA